MPAAPGPPGPPGSPGVTAAVVAVGAAGWLPGGACDAVYWWHRPACAAGHSQARGAHCGGHSRPPEGSVEQAAYEPRHLQVRHPCLLCVCVCVCVCVCHKHPCVLLMCFTGCWMCCSLRGVELAVSSRFDCCAGQVCAVARAGNVRRQKLPTSSDAAGPLSLA
jgi:hypothetical protein